MPSDLQERLFGLLLALPALMIGFTVHEFAHAWMADRCGDDLARRQGRLTLDPLAHLDPFGTIFMLIAWMSGYGVGWAKPVPVHVQNLRHPRRDSMLVAIAGPLSNILQMPIWLLLLALFNFVAMRAHWIQSPGDLWISGVPQNIPGIIGAILINGVIINIGMAAFNMIPIPPLDGHWILAGLGPPFVAQLFDAIRPFSFFLLIVLLQVHFHDTTLLGAVITPFYDMAYRVVFLALRFSA